MSGRTNSTKSKTVGHYITGINKTGISSSSTRFLERLIISHKTVVISRGYKGHLCHLEDFESNLIHLNKPTHTCSESWWVSPSNYWHLGRVWILSYIGRVHFIWYLFFLTFYCLIYSFICSFFLNSLKITFSLFTNHGWCVTTTTTTTPQYEDITQLPLNYFCDSDWSVILI